MPITNMAAGIAHTYTGLALEPDPWLQGALGELRTTLDVDVASVSGMQQRVWSNVLAKIEADEIAEVDRLPRVGPHADANWRHAGAA